MEAEKYVALDAEELGRTRATHRIVVARNIVTAQLSSLGPGPHRRTTVAADCHTK